MQELSMAEKLANIFWDWGGYHKEGCDDIHCDCTKADKVECIRLEYGDEVAEVAAERFN